MLCEVYCGKLKLTLDGKDDKELFERLSEVQEVFGQGKCGACQSEDVKFVVREVDGNKFYEVVCNACRAKLGFGQHKKGNTMFPRRKDGDGNYIPNKGWEKWEGKAK